jgi:hypothetical protein
VATKVPDAANASWRRREKQKKGNTKKTEKENNKINKK